MSQKRHKCVVGRCTGSGRQLQIVSAALRYQNNVTEMTYTLVQPESRLYSCMAEW